MKSAATCATNVMKGCSVQVENKPANILHQRRAGESLSVGSLSNVIKNNLWSASPTEHTG